MSASPRGDVPAVRSVCPVLTTDLGRQTRENGTVGLIEANVASDICPDEHRHEQKKMLVRCFAVSQHQGSGSHCRHSFSQDIHANVLKSMAQHVEEKRGIFNDPTFPTIMKAFGPRPACDSTTAD